MRPFRPRAARIVSGVLGAATIAGTVVVMASLAFQGIAVSPGAAAGAITTAVVVVVLCWLQYHVGAFPDERGLMVRNLVERRHVAWEEIVSVRFGPDSPWVRLDLLDASTLAVMGIQQSDGAHARREATRLATLVALHEGHEGDRTR